jgi:hypothetical protein
MDISNEVVLKNKYDEDAKPSYFESTKNEFECILTNM